MIAKPELLAPAGQPDAGYAALHYGADAVYLGLNKFSARAEAVNFTPPELAAFTAYAHSLSPRRKVYLTLNTLVQQHELADAVETLETAADCDVDAVIVQDWGIARILKQHFPSLTLHASTQMAVHNLEGARMAKRLGCARVTLARELTLEEVAVIARGAGIEVETFIHGTLCYAYSGLCLFSSMLTGRSGNRGRCVYSCREATPGPYGPRHPFSLKDMALGKRVLDLAKAGAASLKIEGRKKSPLYVAATVDYYRRILDGTLDDHDERILADRLKTVFARPWTTLFLDKTHNPDAADTGVVGHRGAPLGKVEGIVRTPNGNGVALTPRLPVERHDGMQLDIPGQSRPYGFAIDNLFILEGKNAKPVFAAPAGVKVAVTLPEDTPVLSPGLPVYLSSSQEVKRSYPYPKPKQETFGKILDGTLDASILSGDVSGSCIIRATATVRAPEFLASDQKGRERHFSASGEMTAVCFAARAPEGPRQAAEGAFARTGASRFRLRPDSFNNPSGVFVKPGDWNRLRREIVERLEEEYTELRRVFRRNCLAALTCTPETRKENAAPGISDRFAWAVCTDAVSDLDAFSREDFSRADEVITGIAPHGLESVDNVLESLDALAGRCGQEKIRIALPLILRTSMHDAIRNLDERLEKEGWRRRFVSGPGGLEIAMGRNLDVAADWMLHVMNAQAAEQLLDLGCSAFTFSPEDDAENMRMLAPVYSRQAWAVVYSVLPLFISAACVHANLGLCGGKSRKCTHEANPLAFTMERSGNVRIQAGGCGTVATGETPFSLMGGLDVLNNMGVRKLRIDLRWGRRKPPENLAVWRSSLAEENIPGHEGNFQRGLL